ncbi:MAG: drug/metabolite exporter YedA [Ktedonobacteraceae bacterium]
MKQSLQPKRTSTRTQLESNVPTTNKDTQVPSAQSGSRFLIILSLLSLYLLWGTTYLAMRVSLLGFPPFLMAAIRFLLAGSILFAILRLRGAPAPSRAQWIGSGLIGILLLAIGNGGVAFAEQWVSSGLAAVGVAAVPLWTALFAGLLGRWPTRLEWFGLVLGFIGVMTLNFGNGMWATPLGAMALLLAPMGWAIGSVLSQRVSLPAGMMSSATEMLVGGSVLVLMSLGLRERAPNLTVVPALWALVFLVIFGSLVAFSAYGYLLRHVRPALATSYAYVNPMVAVGLGVLFVGEKLTALEILAIMITLAGVVLVSIGRTRPR